MSIETPVTQESAPAVTKVVDSANPPIEHVAGNPVAPTAVEAPVETPVEAPATTETPVAEAAKDENLAVVEAVPTSEGVLGYKAPGLLK